jgi:hypothetical protein
MVVMCEIIIFVGAGKLEVTYEATFSVGEDELFRLVFAEFIDSVYNGLWHWYDVPGWSRYPLACR